MLRVLGLAITAAVLAAVRYLHETGVKTVSVVGASFGGWAAAQAAVEAKQGEILRFLSEP